MVRHGAQRVRRGVRVTGAHDCRLRRLGYMIEWGLKEPKADKPGTGKGGAGGEPEAGEGGVGREEPETGRRDGLRKRRLDGGPVDQAVYGGKLFM